MPGVTAADTTPYEHCWLDASSNIHCYYIIEDVDAFEARAACATPGGHLATIESLEEKDSVRNYTLQRKTTSLFLHVIYEYSINIQLSG